MKIIDYSHKITEELSLPEYFATYYPELKPVFFDIETTGLSAKNSTLYLIGALWYDDNVIHIRQWFNNDGSSEDELIMSFNNFCVNYSHLIHFNGLTFDIPYLCQKAEVYGHDNPSWKDMTQIDIYKDIRSYKRLLGLDNMKQVSIEDYLGISRDDTLNGKDLINIYQRYVAMPDEHKESLLLLHNHDDLLGMPAISHILTYKALFEDTRLNEHTIQTDITESSLSIEFNTPDVCRIPKRVAITDRHGIFINAINNTVLLKIPIINDTLKHYFSDYRNYYYLPKEDMAVHKSVATYVEPENRIKATRQNCYVTHKAAFIPCYDKTYTETFKKDFKDRQCYITAESFLESPDSFKVQYICHIMHGFL